MGIAFSSFPWRFAPAPPVPVRSSSRALAVAGRPEASPVSRLASQRPPDPLRALVDKANGGDPDAVQALILEVGGGMLRTVRKVLGASHPDVEDVTQDAVLGLLDSLPRFRGDCSVGHFANQVALRRALHMRRSFLVRDRVGDLRHADEDFGSTDLSPLDLALSKERRRVVRRLLAELSEPIAEALALHFILGHTVHEIALALDISPNTIWSRLKLGKKALQQAFGDDARLNELLEGES